MNIFSEDTFLDTLGSVYYPDRPLTSDLFEQAGRVWKLPVYQGQPLAGADLIDFFEPWAAQTAIAPSDFFRSSRSVRYLAQASYQQVSCAQWFEQNLEQKFQPSPTVLWSQFPTWDDFIHHARQRESRLFSDARRRQRKLEEEVGKIQILADDRRPESLEACFRWKSEQLERTHQDNPFNNPKNLDFLRQLVARQIISVCSLSAGDHLIAVHVVMLNQARFYSWITTYDSAYSRYAPGRLLLHFLLEESFKQKHTEFDFLLGGEDYKWNYATHVRLISELGVPPLPQQIERTLISLGGKALSPFPKLKHFVKQRLELS
ncbi:MAG: GNAT family N-acetyltransferase [Synechococcales bacterium]|nr:GNAT family N-acetyltransferase [Synechococcales bacterium]